VLRPLPTCFECLSMTAFFLSFVLQNPRDLTTQDDKKD
jgi:hypothetical protein